MRDYIESLRRDGDLIEIDVAVDPRFELAAVTQRLQREGDQAILFRNVRGAQMPVVSNVYGSRRRLCGIIGAEDGSFCKRWTGLWPAPASAQAPTVQALSPPPRVTGTLADLPWITYYEKDGGPYITSALFLARHPDTGVANLSFHRSQIISPDELRVRLGTTHDLTQYQRIAEERGEALPAALLIGTAPEVFLAACASLPIHEDELAAAAAIRGAPLAMQRCDTIDLAYPTDTEIVIEGHFLPGVRRPEGPFGEFMGYYVGVGDNHVFEPTAVHWREGAMFHSINCGSPEDMHALDFAIATRIYRSLVERVPGVLDVACYPNLMNTVVKIRQEYEGHGRHVLLAAIGAHLDYSKCCIVVDEDVDIHSLDDVMWAFLTRGRADTRAFVLNDVPGFYRDPHKDHWGRLAIDATKPFHRREEFERKRIPGARTLDISRYLPRRG